MHVIPGQRAGDLNISGREYQEESELTSGNIKILYTFGFPGLVCSIQQKGLTGNHAILTNLRTSLRKSGDPNG